jgi:hypothetical protein
MLEPADSGEAREYVKLAFEMSEQFDTPVFLRSTTRVSHSKSVVEISQPVSYEDKTSIRIHAAKYVMVPAMARIRRVEVEKRMRALRDFAETFPENRMEINNPEVGIITAGIPTIMQNGFPGLLLPQTGNGVPPARRDDPRFRSEGPKNLCHRRAGSLPGGADPRPGYRGRG